MQIIYPINAQASRGRAGKGLDGADDRRDLADRRGRRPARAHGPARLRRLAPVNGVSALHTELMKETVFRDLHALYPERIINKTNGVTFRRWLLQANPGLTKLVRDAVGPACWTIPRRSRGSTALAGDAAFRERFVAVRRDNKERARRRSSTSGWHLGRSGRALRRADQAHPRIQAAAPEPARDRRALRGDPRRSPSRTGRRA